MSLFHSFANLILLCLLLAFLSMMLLLGCNSFAPEHYPSLISKSFAETNKRQYQYLKGRKEFDIFNSTGIKNLEVNNSEQEQNISERNLGLYLTYYLFDSFHWQTFSQKISAPVNVLLLAYQRSGSSFLGEILSARPESMYVFEPLIEFSSKRNVKEPSAVRNAIKGLYECDKTTLDSVGKDRTAEIKLLRKVGTADILVDSRKGCLETKIKVVKTIRLRMDVAKPLLEDPKMNLKIIHLVRDPRAILNSLQFTDTWTNSTKTADYQCEHLRNDITLGSQLSSDRYMRVRYEDLISNPLGVAVTLYNFLRIPLHTSLAFYLTTHTEAERFFKYLHQKPGYFSTYRKSTYDTNSWMKTMTETKRKKIETVCSDVMNTLSYVD